MFEKEEEIARLKVSAHHGVAGEVPTAGVAPDRREGGPRLGEANTGTPSGSVHQRLGKAPPVVMFSGEDPETRLVDWLPSLQDFVYAQDF